MKPIQSDAGQTQDIHGQRFRLNDQSASSPTDEFDALSMGSDPKRSQADAPPLTESVTPSALRECESTVSWIRPSKNVTLDEALEKIQLEQRVIGQTPHAESLRSAVSTELNAVPFCFTKGGNSIITAAVCKDLEAEDAFMLYLSSKGLDKEKLLDLYRKFDLELPSIQYPERHHPLRILTADPLSLEILRWQVFSCPCFTILSFELRDTREAINSQINIPQARILFSEETNREIDELFINKHKRAGLEFGHAILHELGHSTEPVPIAPAPRAHIHLTGFARDFAGELATDTLAGCILGPSAPEMSLYTFLVRVPGHWARRGFSVNSLNAWVNSDNDSLVGAFYWGFFRQRGVIEGTNDGKWLVHNERIYETFREILTELREAIASASTEKGQNDAVLNLARRYVPHGEDGFELSDELKDAFTAVLHLPEVPVIVPRVGVIQI